MKAIKLFSSLALVVLASACVKEIQQEQIDSQNGITQITASFADVESKTVIGEDGSSILWSPGDEINVFYGKSKVKFTALCDEPSNVAIFGSNQSLMFIGNEGQEAYIWGAYPYSTDNLYDGNSVTLSVPSEQSAVPGSFAPGSFPSVGRSKTTSMGFFNVCGGMMFTVSQSGIKSVTFKGNNNEVLAGKAKVVFDGDGKPAVDSLTEGATEVTVCAPNGETFEVGTKYYMSLLPATLGNGWSLTFKKDSLEATYTSSSPVEIKRSVFGKVLDKDKGLVWILAVEDLSAYGTANCYIVSKAGTYEFKAVQGNSSTSVGDVKGVKVLWESFGTGVTPSVGDLIQPNVSYKDNYITFSTNSTYKEGNAVIAAYGDAGCSDGNVLWSWHIWLCKDFDPAATAQVYNNSAGTMMDRNLGATSAAKGDVKALGLLYQWGRKDPFLSGDKISYSSSTGQQHAASTLSWPSVVSSNSSNGTIAYAVSHPTTFITYNSNNYDWYYTGSSSTDNTRWQTSDKTKGVYDPCPAGWRVPDGGSSGVWSKAFGSSSYYSSGPWDSTNNGMDFGSGNGKSSSKQLGSATTIWYPAAGYRYGDDGSLYSVGYGGGYWSCTPYSCCAYGLYFCSDGGVYPSSSNYRAYGQSVRCLSE